MDRQLIPGALFGLLLAMNPVMAQDNSAPNISADNSAFNESSSRKLIGDAKAAWITEMRSKLPMAERKIGPFGMSQNPNVQVAQKSNKKLKPGAFRNVIKAIKINAVVASENKFIIGSREFRAGDALRVIRGQRQFNLKIITVRPSRIVFKDIDTGEQVVRNLNALPPGISRNSSILSVPGVVPASKKDKSPLLLASPTVPTRNNENNRNK